MRSEPKEFRIAKATLYLRYRRSREKLSEYWNSKKEGHIPEYLMILTDQMYERNNTLRAVIQSVYDHSPTDPKNIIKAAKLKADQRKKLSDSQIP